MACARNVSKDTLFTPKKMGVGVSTDLQRLKAARNMIGTLRQLQPRRFPTWPLAKTQLLYSTGRNRWAEY